MSDSTLKRRHLLRIETVFYLCDLTIPRFQAYYQWCRTSVRRMCLQNNWPILFDGKSRAQDSEAYHASFLTVVPSNRSTWLTLTGPSSPDFDGFLRNGKLTPSRCSWRLFWADGRRSVHRSLARLWRWKAFYEFRSDRRRHQLPTGLRDNVYRRV